MSRPHECGELQSLGDHRMHGAKLRCVTLATRRERTLRTAQITMTTRLGKRRLQLLPSTCCGGECTDGGRDRHGRLLTRAPRRFRRKDGRPPIEWMAAAPLHCGTCRKRAAHPAGDQLCLALVDPPGVSEFGVFTRFTGLLPRETGCWDSGPEGYAMIRVMAVMARVRNEFRNA